MFFKSNFSYSNSNSSYSDLLLEIDSGNVQSIYYYPRKREIDVLKNGYVQTFINDLRDILRYDKSSKYITSSLATTENTETINP